MQESAAEANASATDEEVGSAVERNIILWLTNVSHGVNHFQNQMMVVLYPVIMPELGFGYAELGVLLAVQSMLGGATQGFYGFATPFLPRTWWASAISSWGSVLWPRASSTPLAVS